MRFTIRPPGRLPLSNRLFSLVDVPDLRALADLWPDAREIWMGAAPVPEIWHRAFIALAWLKRFKLISTLAPLAPLMHWANSHLRWGEHRGGMFVEVGGVDSSGRNIKRSWHLLAEGDDGPFIPAMAVEALVRAKLMGRRPPPGARAATRDVELDDYAKVFAGKAIYTGTRQDTPGHTKSLFAELLGSAWNELPAAIRAMHDGSGTASGSASVERGTGLLGKLAAFIIGFPKATPNTPVNVSFNVSEGIETWSRRFGDDTFSSQMLAGQGRSEGLLCERFGPFTFAMAPVVEGSRLLLILRRWSAFGIPLPMYLCPRSHSYESAENGAFHFYVELSHPLTGLIVRYKGWLEPD